MSAIRDRISWFTQVAALRPLMVRIFTSIDEAPGHFQILAVAMVLHCACRALGLNAHEILQQIGRMERDVDGPFASQFRAMHEYVKGEFNDGY